jgi:transcriptional regulator with XRE-family HTH domain
MTTPSAGDLLVAARRHLRISQAELARRSGLPRSVVNVYERSGREPGSETMARILDSVGLELVLRTGVRRPDPAHAARILAQVLDLAESLPSRRRPARIDRNPFRELDAR